MKAEITLALLAVRLALTVPEVAQLLGVSTQTVARMIADGRLPARNVAAGRERKSFVVPVEALKKFLGLA